MGDKDVNRPAQAVPPPSGKPSPMPLESVTKGGPKPDYRGMVEPDLTTVAKPDTTQTHSGRK